MAKSEYALLLARMIALHLAGGDKKLALEYLEWAHENPLAKAASAPNSPNREETPRERATRVFIKKYLTPGRLLWDKDISFFIRSRLLRPLDLEYDRIRREIHGMPYRDFLETGYWRGIATYIKEHNLNTCSICGSKENLAVHHTTYENHGDELHHLDDLICVCEECHRKLHEKDNEK